MRRFLFALVFVVNDIVFAVLSGFLLGAIGNLFGLATFGSGFALGIVCFLAFTVLERLWTGRWWWNWVRID